MRNRKLDKMAREIVINRIKAIKEMNKNDLIEAIRPYYNPDIELLQKQDLSRMLNNIISSVKDEDGIREIFIVDDNKEKKIVNLEKTTNEKYVKIITEKFEKDIKARYNTYKKALRKKGYIDGQITLDELAGVIQKVL